MAKSDYIQPNDDAFGAQLLTFKNTIPDYSGTVDVTAGWTLLAMDTTPGYTDTKDFPPKPYKWQYRAIYHAGDSRVGEWSNPVSVTVGG